MEVSRIRLTVVNYSVAVMCLMGLRLMSSLDLSSPGPFTALDRFNFTAEAILCAAAFPDCAHQVLLIHHVILNY